MPGPLLSPLIVSSLVLSPLAPSPLVFTCHVSPCLVSSCLNGSCLLFLVSCLLASFCPDLSSLVSSGRVSSLLVSSGHASSFPDLSNLVSSGLPSSLLRSCPLVWYNLVWSLLVLYPPALTSSIVSSYLVSTCLSSLGSACVLWYLWDCPLLSGLILPVLF